MHSYGYTVYRAGYLCAVILQMTAKITYVSATCLPAIGLVESKEKDLETEVNMEHSKSGQSL